MKSKPTSPRPHHTRVAIVGLPNTGKTLIFNSLTGDYNLVANCPFTTIHTKTQLFEISTDTGMDPKRYELIDTPGIFRFYTYSESEMMTRDLLLSDSPDLLIQCIDAGQLNQSLSLTADLLELGIPMVVCLNAIDETSKRGISVDSSLLSRMLTVPVVESVATQGRGTNALKAAILELDRHRRGASSESLSSSTDAIRAGMDRRGVNGMSHCPYPKGVDASMTEIHGLLPDGLGHKRLWAQLLLTHDPFVQSRLTPYYADDKSSSDEGFTALMTRVKTLRQQYKGNISLEINKIRNRWIDDIVSKVVHKQKIELEDLSKAVAGACRHPLLGVPILFFIIYLMFLLVVHVANNIAAGLETLFWLPVEGFVSQRLPSGFWHDFLIGDYGVLSLGVANAIITVLPILSVFFILFNILEDMGYIPNLTVLTRRIFQRIGLSGASVMPLVLGFGCKTMATMTTKSLQSPREKYISIYLIAFAIPCAAQMGLNMSILGRMGTVAFLIVFGVLFVVEVAAGLLLNMLLEKEDRCFFIQELPPIRMPDPKAVLVKTYYKLYWFLKESLPVFIYAALALFVMDRLGILTGAKTFLKPAMEGFLGLPLEMVDALILCMARHEAAAGLIMNLIDTGKLDFIQCIVAVTITTMFIPCFANIMAMIHELKWKSALGMALVINISSFVIAGGLNWVLHLIY